MILDFLEMTPLMFHQSVNHLGVQWDRWTTWRFQVKIPSVNFRLAKCPIWRFQRVAKRHQNKWKPLVQYWIISWFEVSYGCHTIFGRRDSIPRFIYIVTCLTLIPVDNVQMDSFPLFISHCSQCSIYLFFLVNLPNFWKSLRPCLGAAPTHAITRHQGGSPREPSKHLACHGSCKTSSREGAGEGHGREVGYVSPEWDSWCFFCDWIFVGICLIGYVLIGYVFGMLMGYLIWVHRIS